MTEKTYVIGHQNPDLDSVAAAIGYAEFKNRQSGSNDHQPAIAGPVNRETAYALEKFGFGQPEILAAAAGQKLLLVDHNEFSQAVAGIGEARIVEILDHHKLDFKYSEPIQVLVRPWGSSAAIVYDQFMGAGMEISANLAGLLLSAALVDTVITKSPTCTDADRQIIASLAELAGITDWQAYGLELFKVRSSINDLSAEEIIFSDFKDFNMKAGKMGIGQVETADLSEFRQRTTEFLDGLKQIKDKGAYHSTILLITDIIQEGSLFLVQTDDPEAFARAMGRDLKDKQVYIPGVVSRKKQVAPNFSQVFDK